MENSHSFQGFSLPTLFTIEEIMKNKKRMVAYAFDDQLKITQQYDGISEDGGIDAELAKASGHRVYEILETGGFLKLYNMPNARWYWHLQALTGNRVPDWKLHFSVAETSHAVAWDILCTIFIAMGCRSGLKMQTQGEHWPAFQRGREFTVYLFRHSETFDAMQQERDIMFVRHEDEQPAAFWLEFVAAVETAFAAAGVQSNGTADGDLALGAYASLRNEAFVLRRDEWNLPEGWSGVDLGGQTPMMYVYPPNMAGYNAARHVCPLPLPWRSRAPLVAWVASAVVLVASVVCMYRSRE